MNVSKKFKKIISFVLIFAILFSSYVPKAKAAYWEATYLQNHYVYTGPGAQYDVYYSGGTKFVAKAGQTTTMPSNQLFPDESPNGDCSGGWYQVQYTSTKIGYACNKYISIAYYNGDVADSYGRPWTTPKKSIVGGAKWISSGYIDAGQFTSYLKKFNVNPSGSYPVYNHQYMANVQAPLTESLKTFSAYKAANILDLPMVFSIPVFDNMPASNATLINNSSNTSYVAPLADAAFEESIKDFPDSYKYRLRELHLLHPNWIFEMMNTGLDWNATISTEMNVSSIGLNDKNYCQVSGTTCISSGESGWYLVNYATTAYLMDPRNMLTEDRVYQFEKLTFSTNHTTNVIQNVLNGTHMSGSSALDNQTYAQIFYEAGQSANVNAVYLAALSVQETHKGGGVGSITTTGEEFEYNGITYRGVYNFYNIAAYGTEASPAKAGLVWACNGSDSCVVQPSGVNPVPAFVAGKGYKIVNETLTGFSVINNTVTDIRNTLPGATVNITTSGGELICDSCKVGTGSLISVVKDGFSKNYTVLIYGDVTGDGSVDLVDLVRLRQHLLGSGLSGVYQTAADADRSNAVDLMDLVRLRQHLLGTNYIIQ